MVAALPRNGARARVQLIEKDHRVAALRNVETVPPQAWRDIPSGAQRCDPVLFLDPVEAGVDGLGKLVERVRHLGISFEQGFDRPLDPTRSLAHKRFQMVNVAHLETLIAVRAHRRHSHQVRRAGTGAAAGAWR